MDFVGIGSLNLDYIYEINDLSYIEDLGLEEGVEVIWSEKKEGMLKGRLGIFGTLKKISAGGSAANTIHMLSLMGYRTGLFGILGKDKEAEIYLGELKDEDRRKILRRGRTNIAYIINLKDRERIIVVVPKGSGSIRKADLDFSYLGEAKWIHMTSLINEEAMEVQKSIKEELLGKVRFSIDPGHLYALKKGNLFELMDGMDVLFATGKEMTYIFEKDEERAVNEALTFVDTLVLKRGKDGASIYKKGYVFHVSGEKVDKVDDTGAGDVLAGIFLAFYAKGVDPSIALSVAVKGASLSLRDYGRQGYPRKGEVEKIYENMLVYNRKG